MRLAAGLSLGRGGCLRCAPAMQAARCRLRPACAWQQAVTPPGVHRERSGRLLPRWSVRMANRIWGNETVMNFLKTGVFHHRPPFTPAIHFEDPHGKPGCDMMGVNNYSRRAWRWSAQQCSHVAHLSKQQAEDAAAADLPNSSWPACA